MSLRRAPPDSMGLKPGSTGPLGDMLGIWSPSPGNQVLLLRSKVAQRGRKHVKSFMQPGEPALGPGASPSPLWPWFTIYRMNKPKPPVLVPTLMVHIPSLDLHLASVRLEAGLNKALEKFGDQPKCTQRELHTLALLASHPNAFFYSALKSTSFSLLLFSWLRHILQPLASLSISAPPPPCALGTLYPSPPLS